MSNYSTEPAFPFACQGPTTAPEFYYGLTKRELFAAMAMQGLVTTQKDPFETADIEAAARVAISALAAVRYADALIARLEKGKEEGNERRE